MFSHVSKIGLGTAQWGLPYGVSNLSGQTSPDEVSKILKAASNLGISLLDTARNYGRAEDVLGCNDLHDFRIITKLPALRSAQSFPDSVQKELDLWFAQSLISIGTESVEGLLVHNCEDLFSVSGPKVLGFLDSQKALGKCRYVGVSVYNVDQIKKLVEIFIPDIIQLPFSVLDQRLLQDGTLSHLKGLGIEIHARSVFLQGLMLMEIQDLPSYFKPWLPQLSLWHQTCLKLRMKPQHLALDYVASTTWLTK